MEIITRAEAKERGLKRYFTGVACKRGHISERDVYLRRCLECKKNSDSIAHKQYYTDNKLKIITQQAEYKIANEDKIKYCKRNEYQKNKLSYKDRLNCWIEKNTIRYQVIRKNSLHKRRTSERKGDVTTAQLLHLQTRSTHCYWCNTPLKNKASHVDHYIPLSKGGEHTISNLVMACAKCNLSKGAKMPEVFAMQVGRLL